MQTITNILWKTLWQNLCICGWLFAAMLPLPFAACESGPRVVKESLPITVELRRARGDRTVIQWTLKNQSSRFLVFNNKNTPGGLISDRFEVVASGSSSIRYKGIMQDSWAITKEFYTVVPPMSEFSTTANLADLYALPARAPLKVRCYTFLEFGFYSSENDAKLAIDRIVAKTRGLLPYFKEFETAWLPL